MKDFNYLEKFLYNSVKSFPYKDYKLVSIEFEQNITLLNFSDFYYNNKPSTLPGVYFANPYDEDNQTVSIEHPEYCTMIDLQKVMREIEGKEIPHHNIQLIVEKNMETLCINDNKINA